MDGLSEESTYDVSENDQNPLELAILRAQERDREDYVLGLGDAKGELSSPYVIDLRKYLNGRRNAILADILQANSRFMRGRINTTLRQEYIASGTFGAVYQFQFSGFDREYAVKVLTNTTDEEHQIPQDIAASAKTAGVPIPVVVPMFYESYPYGPVGLNAMVSEFCSHGTIGDVLWHPDKVNDMHPDYVQFQCDNYPDRRMPMHVGMLLLRKLLLITSRFEEPLLHGNHMNQCVSHSDLKFNNIVICNDGQLKAIDFGLAKYVEPNREYPSYISFENKQDRANLMEMLFLSLAGTTLLKDKKMLEVRNEDLEIPDVDNRFTWVQWHRYEKTCLWIMASWFEALYARMIAKLVLMKKYFGDIVRYTDSVLRLVRMANHGVLSKDLIKRIDEDGLMNEVEGLEAALSGAIPANV